MNTINYNYNHSCSLVDFTYGETGAYTTTGLTSKSHIQYNYSQQLESQLIQINEHKK
jgi:hypothetical protein